MDDDSEFRFMMAGVKGWLTRLVRLGLLALAVLCLREAQLRRLVQVDAEALQPERVRDFFPAAAEIEEAAGVESRRVVRDGSGIVLGYVAQTSPESDKVIGYSGATNTLIAFDVQGRILGLRVLRSGDTADHLAEVVADRAFFRQFRGKKAEELRGMQPVAVTGATLTSSAIAEGVLRRLGAVAGSSLKFPEEIGLEEVRALVPEAEAMRASGDLEGGVEVLDDRGEAVGLVVRSAPVTDTVMGYKGPSETLVLLDREGEVIRGVRLRKSYDTKRYVGYVSGDRAFLKSFEGTSVSEMAAMDFADAGVEGVSGATETSWAVAEGLKRKSAALLVEESMPKVGWSGIRWRWQDTGHAGVLLSAFAMAFSRLRGRPWVRHVHHGLLVGYVGLMTGEMMSQGLMLGWAGAGTPWRTAPGLLLMAAVALLGPVLTRRQLYCHHICPHGALQQLLARRLRWQWSPSRRVDQLLSVLPFGLLAAMVFCAMLALPVDLNALEPFDAYLFRIAGWGTMVVALGGLLFALFTPLAYCRYGCPTGAVFKLLRYAGDRDGPGWRDGLAAAVILCAWGLSHVG